MNTLKIRSSVGWDIPHILWKLDVQRCIRRRSPPVLILRQIYLVRVSLSYVWKIHSNIMLPSKPRSSKWSLPFRFSHQNHLCTSPLLLTCPTYLIPLDLITRITFGVQHTSYSSSLYSLLHTPAFSSPLGQNVLLRKLFSKTLSLRSSLNVTDQAISWHCGV